MYQHGNNFAKNIQHQFWLIVYLQYNCLIIQFIIKLFNYKKDTSKNIHYFQIIYLLFIIILFISS